MEICALLLGSASDDSKSGERNEIPDGVFIFRKPASADEVGDEALFTCARPSSDSLNCGKGIAAIDRYMWWKADACAETTLDWARVTLTAIYELMPSPLNGLLCSLVEGQASAFNRQLIPRSGSILQYLLANVHIWGVWALLCTWRFTQPNAAPSIDLMVPCLVLAWRASCIAMKYSFLSPSDLHRIRMSHHWTETRHNIRCLGNHKFFDFTGTLTYDQLEDLLKAALRTDLLEEAKKGLLTVDPGVALHVWERVRPDLEPERISDMHATSLPKSPHWRSKYGDVPSILGLGSLSDIEEQVRVGKLPVMLVAYYFIRRTRQSTRWWYICTAALTFGLSLSFVHPLTRKLSGQAGFGVTPTEHAIYGLRAVCLFPCASPVLFYIALPVFDSVARFKLSWSLLSSFGRGEGRARRLCCGHQDPSFEIKCESDLRAFWCLARLLGPAFDAGTMIRYSSAYISTHVFYLCVATVILMVYSRNGITSWGVSLELTVIFVVGSLAVVLTSAVCVQINSHVPLLIGVARQAAIFHPELGGLAKDICADIQNEHLVVFPIQVMYLAAQPSLLSLLWSGLVVLGSIFFSLMPSVCVPLVFDIGGCSES